MYQSYPAADPARPAPSAQMPPSLRNAVRLMYAGAVLEVIALIVALLTISSLKTAILRQYPSYTATQLHNAQVVSTVTLAVGAVITIGLWLWMARANRGGKSWARIVSTVLFGLNTLILLASLSRPHATIGIVLLLVIWLIGLGAIFFLWRKDSSGYYAVSKLP